MARDIWNQAVKAGEAAIEEVIQREVKNLNSVRYAEGSAEHVRMASYHVVGVNMQRKALEMKEQFGGRQ